MQPKKLARRRQTLESAPLGSIIRINEVARRANHSRDWVERLAHHPDSPLVAVRVPGSKRIVGFTEKSVVAFLNGETVTAKEERHA